MNETIKDKLLSYLQDDDSLIRETALDELDFLCYEGFINDIQVCLKDNDPKIRAIAEEAIERHSKL